MSKYILDKEEQFEMMTVTVDSLEAEAVTFEEVESSLEDLLERFNSVVKDLWVNLMKEEMSLYELCEVGTANYIHYS